jgi:hypothetical protein
VFHSASVSSNVFEAMASWRAISVQNCERRNGFAARTVQGILQALPVANDADHVRSDFDAIGNRLKPRFPERALTRAHILATLTPEVFSQFGPDLD